MGSGISKLVAVAGSVALVVGGCEFAGVMYDVYQEQRLADRPFPMLCASGGLIPGPDTPYLSRGDRGARWLNTFTWNVGGVALPRTDRVIDSAFLGEYPIKGNTFANIYGKYSEPVWKDGNTDLPTIGEGATEHYYLDENSELQPVRFSMVHNTGNHYSGSTSSVWDNGYKQSVVIAAEIPANALYAVYHRTIDLYDAETRAGVPFKGEFYDGWWVTPLVREYRSNDNDHDYGSGEPVDYMDYYNRGQSLECFASVSSQVSLYDDFVVKSFEVGVLEPLKVTRETYDAPMIHIGPKKALADLPSDPRDLYEKYIADED